jgi:hypothetical protein
MYKFRNQTRDWSKHKLAIKAVWMRHGQSRRINLLPSIEDQIKVQRPWSPPNLSRPPKFMLNPLQQVQQLHSAQRRFKNPGRIQKRVASIRSHRNGPVELCRLHCKDSVILPNQRLSTSECLSDITNVTTHRNNGLYHNDSSITLAHSLLKCNIRFIESFLWS